jgi:HPt (histidine-containing phosphotransfer) domain-containing protein
VKLEEKDVQDAKQWVNKIKEMDSQLDDVVGAKEDQNVEKIRKLLNEAMSMGFPESNPRLQAAKAKEMELSGGVKAALTEAIKSRDPDQLSRALTQTKASGMESTVPEELKQATDLHKELLAQRRLRKELKSNMEDKNHEHLLVLLKKAEDLNFDMEDEEIVSAKAYVESVETFRTKLQQAMDSKEPKKIRAVLEKAVSVGLERDKKVKEAETLAKGIAVENAALDSAIKSGDVNELEDAIRQTKKSAGSASYKKAKQQLKTLKSKNDTFYLCRSCGWLD